MKDLRAKELIKNRLKYDWIVLLYGSFCLLIQFLFLSNLEFFLFVVGSYVFVEIFNVRLYRKLLQGGEGYHMFSKQSPDQDSSFGTLLFCIIMDFAVILVTSLNFIIDVVKQNIK
jgi:hypothetical protein